jgi:hypothetical protein
LRSPFGLKQLIETSAVRLPWFKNFRPNSFASQPFGRFALGKFLFCGQIITRTSYIFGCILHKHIHFFKKITAVMFFMNSDAVIVFRIPFLWQNPDSGQFSARAGVFDYLASTISELPVCSAASCVLSAA